MNAPDQISVLPPTFWSMRSPLDDDDDDECVDEVFDASITHWGIYDGCPNEMKRTSSHQVADASSNNASLPSKGGKRMMGMARRVRMKQNVKIAEEEETRAKIDDVMRGSAQQITNSRAQSKPVYKPKLFSNRPKKKNDPVALFALRKAQWEQQERIAARRRRALRQQQQP